MDSQDPNQAETKSTSSTEPTPIVATHSGPLFGYVKDGINVFRGIPYAKPPVGPLRFKAPQPAATWDQPKECRQFGPAAYQANSSFFGVVKMDEDCLSLNVWSKDLAGKKPVMVWIHGGSFVSGSSSQVLYHGEHFSRKDVVLVTINYRLGVLGLGYFKELVEDSSRVDSNIALRDQLAALEWVRDNIAAFGGDPNNVTLFGESAGAMSVGCLLASPKAKGLFHKAILQSGAADHVISADDATKVASTFLAALSEKKDPEALWQASPEEIIAAQLQCFRTVVYRGHHKTPVPQFAMPFVPTVDGDILPDYPMKLIAEGAAKDIPVLIGTTREEWNFFQQTPGADGQSTAQKLADMDADKLEYIFEKNIPGHGQKAREAYLGSEQRENRPHHLQSHSDFESDRMFRIPAIKLAEHHDEHNAPVYKYLLTWDKGVLGAAHAVDIPFVFGDVDKPFGQILTGGGEGAHELHLKIQGAWVAFAENSSPNTEQLPDWPLYCRDKRSTMVLGEICEIEEDPLTQERIFWQAVLY